MAKVRIGTFNVENLFARYNFNSSIEPEAAVQDGWLANQLCFIIHEDASKEITGQTIREIDADVLALQEVENLDTLKRFRSKYLGGKKSYPFVALVDGNDRRLIDVAVLSRLPLDHIRSYQHFWEASWNFYLFSRDCLEVDVLLDGGKRITLYVNHFKSMIYTRSATRRKRLVQSQKVKELVTNRFGENAGDHPFIILGDFNDYIEPSVPQDSGIVDLVQWDQVENIVDRLDPEERWTHYFSRNDEYRQLDYILLSKSLAASNPKKPDIERRGMPYRVERVAEQRFDGVGWDIPKASDHCPVVIELNV